MDEGGGGGGGGCTSRDAREILCARARARARLSAAFPFRRVTACPVRELFPRGAQRAVSSPICVCVHVCARARARCVCVCVRVYAPTSLPSKQVEQTAVVSRRGLSACARETSARCARSPAEGERVVAQGRKNSSNNPDSAEISLRYPVSLRFRST